MDYQEINKRALKQFVEALQAAPADSPIVQANQHLLEANGSTWAGGGMFELGGFIWWTAECDVALTDLSTGVKAVNFEADGTGFMVGACESEVVGAFVVNPSKIPNGKCHYSIAVGAVEEGAITLFLYDTSGKLYGNFTGPSEGLAVGSMSGSGTLKVVST
jgi:hypothetical protein